MLPGEGGIEKGIFNRLNGIVLAALRGKVGKIRILLIALLILLVEVTQFFNLLEPVELVFYDLWHRQAEQRFDPKHVALVIIDDLTLSDHADDPLVFWTPYIARASEVLRQAGARVVGLDFLFSVSPESWLRKFNTMPTADEGSFDQPFRREIGTGQMVMVATRVALPDGKDGFLLPHTDYLMSVPDLDLAGYVALSDLVVDNDSSVRAFRVTPELRLPPETAVGDVPRFALGALLALRAVGADVTQDEWRIAGRDYSARAESWPIVYAGPPGTIRRISLRTLLQPDALALPEVKALKDRVVIIGGEYVGMNDLHPTPYSSSFFGGIKRFMSGPEIQANIVETIMGGLRPTYLPAWVVSTFMATVVIGAFLLFSRIPVAAGLLVVILVSAAYVFLTYVAFLRSLILPVTALPMTLAGTYLVAIALKLTREEKERRRITKIFGRYVSDEVVKVLLEGEHLPELGGEKKIITVLFSDIRGFTSLSEQLDAHEVVEFLNVYFEKVCDVILAEGGTIDKFIGDAVMVQFGAPMTYPDHAMRSVRAALAMREQAEQVRIWMRTRFADKGLADFRIGIGLHSGEAVVGNIGSTRRSEYTAIGDTVNTASRIEGMTKDMGCEILASRETVEAAGDRIITGRTRVVQVKGRDTSVELFEVLGVKGDLS